MRRSAEFSTAVRDGRRVAGRTLVLHLMSRPDAHDHCRVGLVVSRAVGSSVVRHRVSRRLRALCADRLDRCSPGDLLVVRALPAAGHATSEELGRDLDRAWDRVAA